MPERALLSLWPSMAAALPHVSLGSWPTPVAPLSTHSDAFVKRDDLSADAYGGNKIRTLEFLFGDALVRGRRWIWSTGAWGSNHALAAAIHAPTVGLAPGAIVFPQPYSESAAANLRCLLSIPGRVMPIAHWSVLPAAMARVRWRRDTAVMPPGGATPTGAVGYVSAALELAAQVEAGELPAPRTVVVGVGSTCTSAGLLVGFHHAARLGIGFRRPPTLVAARVTPWPVTAHRRIVGLARRTAQLLTTLNPALPMPPRGALSADLDVDGRYLGRGYGYPVEAGRAAAERFAKDDGPALDSTYGAKSGAAFLARLERGTDGPWLYWATKSTRPLPRVRPHVLAAAPRCMRGWLSESSR